LEVGGNEDILVSALARLRDRPGMQEDDNAKMEDLILFFQSHGLLTEELISRWEDVIVYPGGRDITIGGITYSKDTLAPELDIGGVSTNGNTLLDSDEGVIDGKKPYFLSPY
jgi:hypothetical protein